MKNYLKGISMIVILVSSAEAKITSAKKIAVKTIEYSDGSIKKNGHRSWRNNNPGNLEYGNFTKSHGAIGTDGRFAIFPSMEDGYKAQVDLLKGEFYRNKSIKNALQIYAPSFENNTKSYIKAITKKIKVSSSKKIKNLSHKKLMGMVKEMAKQEGMKKGIHINKNMKSTINKLIK